MPKIYILCLVSLLMGAVTVMPLQKNDDFWYYTGCLLAWFSCYIVTIFQDEKAENRPTWKFRLSASIAASYMGFYFYPTVKNLELNLWVTILKPFPTIHIFIGCCSYFGVSIFREAKSIRNFGWRKYIGAIGDKLKAVSKEKK